MSKKEKISQIISRELLQLIESGHYLPGDKLPTEMELSKQFGVSRISVREALSVLRASGLITSRQGGGSYIEENTQSQILRSIHMKSDDVESIRHLFEMRKILEPEAAYLAATRRTTEQLSSMKHVLDKLEYGSLNAEQNHYTNDIAFHRAVILATHNPVMIHMMENLADLYERTLKVTLEPNKELKQKRESVYQEHCRIYEAIELEEPELAKVQSTIHLRNAEKKLSLFLQNYEI
ncbi:GntR family transcriptional regulator, transcriptional repressor for pyruvate dehydrogenase complex [Fictibacillus solisalsi]|uniref:Pyruvate dehydrogenase complex repressor n=1 Tax=Fictibacillus solisalsi TaxID=459525 RepID=A0A1G9U0A7_9BACL|nr:FadR/GntR family transcriptional regulator [Fictibacillus solisalsi]SDM52965.1 GntR family transcriptional regulator, transcriptional repressor for pyruvate dehydrogenase complex [Fictibacillus solisalsi]